MATTNKIAIEMGSASPSQCMPIEAHAFALPVTIRIGRKSLHGEITLVPSRRDGRYASWDAPENWISSDLLAAIRAHQLRDEIMIALHEAADA